jgi:predicted protein tyrosine phosphatase
MKALFVCNQGQHRSRTAEELFKDRFETASAGLFGNGITENQLEWADIVFVMEEFQREELSKRFPKQYMKKKILSLEIPDVFSYNQPELKEILKEKMNSILAIHQIVA